MILFFFVSYSQNIRPLDHLTWLCTQDCYISLSCLCVELSHLSMTKTRSSFFTAISKSSSMFPNVPGFQRHKTEAVVLLFVLFPSCRTESFPVSAIATKAASNVHSPNYFIPVNIQKLSSTQASLWSSTLSNATYSCSTCRFLLNCWF